MSRCTQCDAIAPEGVELCPSCNASQSDSASSSEAGDHLEQIPGERYQIVSRLGTGAFGYVYQARDTFLNRPVAVKTIRLDTSLDPEHREALNKRFIREAQVAAQLQHPNIVTIHDILFTPETGFIVMEYIEGSTLQSLLKEEPIPLATTIDIAIQVAKALQYAHEHNVIHRDIKPANIMITPSFEARITDFGIAKSDGATQLTMSGSLVGTPDYMSPEQAQGKDVDARTDLFSLGCVIYECAVGERPFRGPNLTSVLLSIVNTDPFEQSRWKKRDCSPELERALRRALAKEPADRFTSAAELAEALRGVPVEAKPGLATVPRERESRTVIIRQNEPSPPAIRADELRRLKKDDRPLQFATALSDELQNMSLTPAQGFVLSRIDGTSRARDILNLSPMPESDVGGTLVELLDKGLLVWGEVPHQKTGAESQDQGAKAEPEASTLDPALVKEAQRVLELGTKRCYAEILGVDETSSTAEVKRSYLELLQRFHPDAQPGEITESERRELSRVCAVATEALTAVSAPRTTAAESSDQITIDATPPDPERQRHAESLFRLAQRAFDITDYWEAIQLARQAIELDDRKAAYHSLLGRGLMMNRHWIKEAEESLKRAIELEPSTAEHFEVLASLYKRQGMEERAAAVAEKARTLAAEA